MIENSFMSSVKCSCLLALLAINFDTITCTNQKLNTSGSQSLTIQSSSKSENTYRIIPSMNNTFGYEILVNEKVLIRQTNIPGMPGLNGFNQKEDAIKVAQLVLEKLHQGIMPPTVVKHELNELKIKY